jgi:hypothetical protein
MVGDALPHLGIAHLRGCHVHHVQPGIVGVLLGQTALAGTHTA